MAKKCSDWLKRLLENGEKNRNSEVTFLAEIDRITQESLDIVAFV